MALETLSGAETLQTFLGFVRRQFSVILFVTLLALALGVIYVVTARPSYTAQAQLLIDARKVQVFQQQSILGRFSDRCGAGRKPGRSFEVRNYCVFRNQEPSVLPMILNLSVLEVVF